MRKVLSLILVLMMLVSIVPVSVFADVAEMPAEADTPAAAEASTDVEDPAAAEEDGPATPEIIASGYCGGDTTAEYDEASGAYKNLSWTLDIDGAFTISGTGAMKDYSVGYAPWYSYKSNIYQVKIGNGVANIGSAAFCYCFNLGNVTFGNGVTTIGIQAFASCYNLTSLTFGDSITSIGVGAFERCNGLTSVTIGSGVTCIETFAFSDCSNLKTVNIPDNVVDIQIRAFEDCASLTNINVSEGNTNYSSMDGVLFNKDKTSLECYPSGKTGEYTIPESVINIQVGVFEGCTGLTNINVSEGNTSFSSKDGVLFNKDKTTLIRYPAGKISNYTIPDGVIYIGSSAFSECSGLMNVTIPGSVINIGGSAFISCTSLTNVTIPDKVAFIGSHAFERCTSLTDVTIGKSAIRIGGNAFYICNNIKHVKFTGNEPAAFDSSIFYPSNIKILAPRDWASSEAYDARNQTWNGYQIEFYETEVPNLIDSGKCSNTLVWTFDADGTLTIYGIGVLSSPQQSWKNYKANIKNVVIEDGVTAIESTVFYGYSSITGVTIPNSVTSIGDLLFYNCSNLTSAKFEGDAPTEFAVGAFLSCAPDFKILAPCGNETWKSSAYDDDIGKWNSYPIEFYGSHTYNSTVTAPSCTEQGFTTYTCTGCGDSYVDDYVDALDHDYQDGACTRCGEKEPTSIFTEIANAINNVITTITNFVKSLFSWLPF